MFRIDRQRDVTIVGLGKTYDSLNPARLDELRDRLLAAADEVGPPLLVIDFARTEFIGSSFIELLVRAWKRIRDRGGTMALCCLNAFCEEVIRVVRLDQVWPVLPTRDAAVGLLTQKH